ISACVVVQSLPLKKNASPKTALVALSIPKVVLRLLPTIKAAKPGTDPNKFSKNGIGARLAIAAWIVAVGDDEVIPCKARLRRRSSIIPAAVYQSIPDFGSVRLFGIITSRDNSRLRPRRPI